MKAVQVDESKDTNTMCSLGESLYYCIQQSIGGHESV